MNITSPDWDLTDWLCAGLIAAMVAVTIWMGLCVADYYMNFHN